MARAQAAFDDILRVVLEFGGTIIGEHGVGLLKRPFLEKHLRPESTRLHHTLKAALDPLGILNPGKLLYPVFCAVFVRELRGFIMIDASGGVVKVFFANSIRDVDGISRPLLLVTPEQSNRSWNDFGYNLNAKLYLLLEGGIDLYCCSLKILFKNTRHSTDYLESMFARLGRTVSVEQVDVPFCSMLVRDTAYRELVYRLGLKEALYGLTQLGDAIVLDANGQPDSRLELARSKPFHLGALRSLDAYGTWRRAKRHLRYDVPEFIEDSAVNFSVEVSLPDLKNSYVIDFDFNKKELIRNRMAVLIGRNGVGKTQILLSMIKALAKSSSEELVPGALAKAQFKPAPLFNSVLAFSSVSSDLYPESIAPWLGGIDYTYFSLIARESKNAPAGVDMLTASLADIIRSDDYFELSEIHGGRRERKDVLKDALSPHIDYHEVYIPLSDATPSGFAGCRVLAGEKYVSLGDVNGEQRKIEILHYLNWGRPPVVLKDGVARRLSSGQLAMMRFAVQAVGSVRAGSLLLMDEPETHLHPNFVSAFVDILHTVLEATKSCAIIATHSAYIVREVPRSRVVVLRVDDEMNAEVVSPRLQTFGASVDSISLFVFGDAEVEHLHELLLRQWLGNVGSIEEVLEKYGSELNSESLLYVRRVIDARNAK